MVMRAGTQGLAIWKCEYRCGLPLPTYAWGPGTGGSVCGGGSVGGTPTQLKTRSALSVEKTNQSIVSRVIRMLLPEHLKLVSN